MDQFREGVKVVIGWTSDDICTKSLLFCHICPMRATPRPTVLWHNRTLLSKMKFVNHVKLALLKANLLAQKYAGHSFQISAATTAASAGIEESTIQTLGCWQSSSYLLCIRLDPCHIWHHFHPLQLRTKLNSQPSLWGTSQYLCSYILHIYTLFYCGSAVYFYYLIPHCNCCGIIVVSLNCNSCLYGQRSKSYPLSTLLTKMPVQLMYQLFWKVIFSSVLKVM